MIEQPMPLLSSADLEAFRATSEHLRAWCGRNETLEQRVEYWAQVERAVDALRATLDSHEALVRAAVRLLAAQRDDYHLPFETWAGWRNWQRIGLHFWPFPAQQEVLAARADLIDLLLAAGHLTDGAVTTPKSEAGSGDRGDAATTAPLIDCEWVVVADKPEAGG